MASIAKYVLMAAIIGGIVGCASQRGAQYVDPNQIISGRPEQPTMYDLESSAESLIKKMNEHPQFLKNYNSVKVTKGKVPVVCLGLLENKTTLDVRARLRAVNDTIRVALFDTNLFEVKDDEASEAIISRIVRSADGGIENSKELTNAFGEHAPPDFIVLGDLRHFTDVGGYHTYRLRIAIHNLKTGKIVWEGIQTKVKL